MKKRLTIGAVTADHLESVTLVVPVNRDGGNLTQRVPLLYNYTINSFNRF